MREPTTDESRELHRLLIKMRDSDRSAGRRHQAKRIINEFEAGYTIESIFIACARKLLKVQRPDHAELEIQDAKELAELRAQLFEERSKARAEQAIAQLTPSPAVVTKRTRKKRVKV